MSHSKNEPSPSDDDSAVEPFIGFIIPTLILAIITIICVRSILFSAAVDSAVFQLVGFPPLLFGCGLALWCVLRRLVKAKRHVYGLQILVAGQILGSIIGLTATVQTFYTPNAEKGYGQILIQDWIFPRCTESNVGRSYLCIDKLHKVDHAAASGLIYDVKNTFNELADIAVDSLSRYFLIVVFFLFLCASCFIYDVLLPSANALDNEDSKPNAGSVPGARTRIVRYCLLFHIFQMVLAITLIVDSLITLWISFQLLTITSMYLISYRRNYIHYEAAWKYAVLTSVGIVFALFGTILLVNSIGNRVDVGGIRWSWLMQAALHQPENFRTAYLVLAFGFILVGFGTKAGLAPAFHWLPDAHSVAPYPISSIFSGVLVKVAIYGILRYFIILTCVGDRTGGLDLQSIAEIGMMVIGMISMAMAVPFIINSNTFKRILAYHTFEHMGIITLGFGFDNRLAIAGALLHILSHGLMKMLCFVCYGGVRRQFEEVVGPKAEAKLLYKNYRNAELKFSGIFSRNPTAASLLGLAVLGLAGLPPFCVFSSKLLILLGGIEAARAPGPVGTVAAAGVLIFGLAVGIIFIAITFHLSRLLIGPPVTRGEIRKEIDKSADHPTDWSKFTDDEAIDNKKIIGDEKTIDDDWPKRPHSTILISLTGLAIVIGVAPIFSVGPFNTIWRQATEIVFYGKNIHQHVYRASKSRFPSMRNLGLDDSN